VSDRFEAIEVARKARLERTRTQPSGLDLVRGGLTPLRPAGEAAFRAMER
jgi:hypothetical protein